MTKKLKPKPKVNKRFAKTVVQHCTTVSDWSEILLIAKRYTCVKNYVYSRYSGVNSLLILQNYKKEIRDEWVKTKFAEQWKLPARYWKLALDEAISNIKSVWSNTKNQVKKLIRQNSHITEDEKRYIYYILKADPLLCKVLTHTSFTMPKTLSEMFIRVHTIHNLIRRYIRKSKGSVPYSYKETSFVIDKPMYHYRGKNQIEITSTIPRKRILLTLTDHNIYSGNIRIVLKDNHIELHHCVKSKEKQGWSVENEVAIDKGYRTLLATSSGKLYGEKLNDLLSKETERLKGVNQKRNQIWAQMKKCKEAGEIQKANRILKNNFGRKKYDLNRNKHDGTVKSFINFSLNQFFRNEKPSEVIQEDLSFVSWKEAFPKHIKRKLCRWIKGYIKGRIEYKCQQWKVSYKLVNAAYTSQICHQCHGFGKRNQDVFTCERCGTMHADLNAAVNIKERKYDPDITLYTPYKKVKEILEERIQKPSLQTV